MSTIKQIQANRLNALKSTGPRTLHGKGASSMNALRTGIDADSHVIAGEDPAAFQSLVNDYFERFQPSAPEQRALVETLISNDWLMRRLRKLEAQLWTHQWNAYEKGGHLNLEAPLADVFQGIHKTLARVQSRMNSAERNYHRALKHLQSLQPPAPPPQPADSKPAPRPNGFVPQTGSDDPLPLPKPVTINTQSTPHIAAPPPVTLK
jgi:hypothetical protein